MENTSDKDMRSYSSMRKRGIDDLLSEFAFVGNSQGDESASNDIEVYKASGGWMSCIFSGVDPTDQEAINKEVERRKKANLEYIEELKAKGEFGKDFEYLIHIKHNPIFDHPTSPREVLESSKLIFLDNEEYNGEPNIQE